jgi:hypothetical protein
MTQVLGGGAQQRRGGQHQDYSLLYYLLFRLLDHPDLTFQPESNEDATIRYSAEDGKPDVVEYVQCKKKESGSDWTPGKFDLDDLRQWVVEKRLGQSAVDLLQANDNAFFTALLFGELSPRRTGKFVPEQLTGTHLPYPTKALRTAFPVNYVHPGGRFARLSNLPMSDDVKARIRLMNTAAPQQLRTVCRITLFEQYQVAVTYLDSVLNRLLLLIQDESASQGIIDGADILSLIAQSRAGSGRWKGHHDLLRLGSSSFADPNRGELLSGADFAAKRFADRPEFQTAWDAVTAPGALVAVNGTVGTGKTTMCRYLMHRFVTSQPGRRAYYLLVDPGDDLLDEQTFFQHQLDTETLFVIDDEHLASGAVEQLIQTFADASMSMHVRARLVVSSRINVGRTEALAGGRWAGELRRAVHIPLPNRSTDVIRRLMTEIKSRQGLRTTLSDETLAVVSEGVLGVALLLARANPPETPLLTRDDMMTGDALRSLLAKWIIESIERWHVRVDFAEDVAPILVLASLRLPIPANYSNFVTSLFDAGFLIARDDPANKIYAIADENLGVMLQRQYKSRIGEWALNYVARYPRSITALVLCLEQVRELSILETVVDKNFDEVLARLAGPSDPLPLNIAARVLHAIHRASRYLSARLYRLWALPANAMNPWFLRDLISRAADAGELAAILHVINDADRHVGALLKLGTKLNDDDAALIEAVFERNHSTLDSCGRLLYELKRISEGFARHLYQRFKTSAKYEAVAAGTNGDDDLPTVLKLCDQLRTVDRAEAYRLLEHRFTPSVVVAKILATTDLTQTMSFLLRLQRVHPRRSAEILNLLWSEHETDVTNLLSAQRDTDHLVQLLYAWSRTSRLVGAHAARGVAGRLKALVRDEKRYEAVAGTIYMVGKWVYRRLAAELCEAVDKPAVLTLLKQERRYASRVGKFLTFIHQFCPATAAWFEELLDYNEILRLARAPKLLNVIELITGFIHAAGVERRPVLVRQMLDDQSLHTLCRGRYEDTQSISEMSSALVELIRCPLQYSEILRLLGVANIGELEQDVRKRITPETNILDVAHGLFGLARINIRTARAVLRHFTETTLSATYASLRVSQNVVELGCCFQIAAAIDSAYALQLVTGRSIASLRAAAAAEPNFGRQAVLLIGTARASRRVSREVVAGIAESVVWRTQYDHNDNMDNMIHYSRALAAISRQKAVDFAHFAYEQVGQHIVERLRVETNGNMIGQWLRLLAVAGEDLVKTHAGAVVPLLAETREVDTEVWHLLECAEALLDVGHRDEARKFAMTAYDERRQLRNLRSLKDLIVLFNKAIHLAPEIGIPQLPNDLATALTDNDISLLASTERDLVLVAYFQHLALSVDLGACSRVAHEWARKRSAVDALLKDESRDVHKVAALILADATPDTVMEEMVAADWRRMRAWEMGLLDYLFSSVRGGSLGTVFDLAGLAHQDWLELIEPDLAEHASNIHFGLALRVAARVAPSKAAFYEQDRIERLTDESNASRRWLLQGNDSAAGKPYYVWTYLTETILSSTYLPWEEDVEARATAIAYDHKYVPDIAALVPA